MCPADNPTHSGKNALSHIAIIMDGNGRWAKKRFLPRFAGHKAGLEAVRKTVSSCVKANVKYLTLFAFSSENWRRPEKEVSLLMELFEYALKKEVDKLHKNNIRLKIIGDLNRFSQSLQELINNAVILTENNTGLCLTIAANYGGRWDIVETVKNICKKISNKEFNIEEIDEFTVESSLSTHFLPEPDLFIRTGGEKRISNFLLWDLAYSEFYFTDILWPDFDETELNKSLESFNQRQRRFGRTGDQLKIKKG